MAAENPYERESRRLNRQFAQELLACLDTSGLAIRVVAAGRVVMRAGTSPQALPYIEAGALQAEIHTGVDGHRVVPATFEAGEVAMCSLLFSASPVHADIVTVGPCRLRWLARDSVETAVAARPELALPLVRFLAQRLREVQMRERIWLSRSLRGRVWAALMREVGGTPSAPEGRSIVALTHESLAARAGVSRPRLSMALKALERDGKVRLGRGRIEMLSR